MYLVRKTKKADYDYYLKSFKNNRFQFYGNFSKKNLSKYIHKLVITEYENVYRYIVEKNNIPIGFFHLYIQNDNIAEVSIGSFEKFNSIYGLYIAIIPMYIIFKYYKNVNKIISTVHKKNFNAQKINTKIGGKRGEDINNKYSYYLEKKDFPNEFVEKILTRIEKEGIIYEK